MKQLICIFILFSITCYSEEFTLLKGSNIYSRFFMFNFPVSEEYSAFFYKDNENITIEIVADRFDINPEPSTPPLFNTEILFRLKEIPYQTNGRHRIPITIRCNRKVIFTKMWINLVYRNNVFVIRSSLSGLKISDLTDDPFFAHRSDWHYPFFFDLRIEETH